MVINKPLKVYYMPYKLVEIVKQTLNLIQPNPLIRLHRVAFVKTLHMHRALAKVILFHCANRFLITQTCNKNNKREACHYDKTLSIQCLMTRNYARRLVYLHAIGVNRQALNSKSRLNLRLWRFADFLLLRWRSHVPWNCPRGGGGGEGGLRALRLIGEQIS